MVCPGYDIKQSGAKTPVLELGGVKYPFIAIAPRSILTGSGSNW